MYLLPKEHHHGQVIKTIKTLLLIVENIFWCWGVSKSFSVNQETQQIRLLSHNNTDADDADEEDDFDDGGGDDEDEDIRLQTSIPSTPP